MSRVLTRINASDSRRKAYVTARYLLQVAKAIGVPVTVSSALDSAVGMAAGVAAAAALPVPPGVGEPPAAGLGTGGFFLEDVVSPGAGFDPVDGALEVRAVTPEPDRLAGLADADRAALGDHRLYDGWATATPHLADHDAKRTRKLMDSLESAIAASGLRDGGTISFHHHFREGDA